MATETKQPPWTDRWLSVVTNFSATRPLLTLILALLTTVGAWTYATGLKIEGSFVELLPTDSPTGRRFRETLSRKAGGNATLIVLSQGTNQEHNRSFVDRLERSILQLPPSQVHSVEKGPGPARDFFLEHKWLFASEPDLALLRCRIEREHEKRMPGYLDLEDPCDETVDVPLSDDDVSLGAVTEPDQASGAKSSGTKDAQPAAPNEQKSSARSELQKVEGELEDRLRQIDRFPEGYFTNEDGTVYSIMIRAPSAGMGEFSSDELFTKVKAEAARISKDFPDIEVGFAGDIPNAIEQRDALVSDMATISFLAIGLILGSIILYFRSVVALLQIGFCVTVGCGLAFAMAMAAYGRLNTATSFLGSIIAGNGINYSIVYLARYRELRARGIPALEALEQAAQSSKKGTWLASLAAGGAYAALLLTSFRGFSEFGLIGGLGMVFCWGATFALLPAQVVLAERWGLVKNAARPTRISLAALGRWATRHATWVLVGATVLTTAALVPLPEYLKDPWEYNFSQLGSRSSKKKGAGQWSRSANQVFQSRGSPMVMMTDHIGQALDIRRQLRQQDQLITGGTYVERAETIYDRLGGSPEVVARKLQLLSEIRAEIDEVLPHLSGEDRQIAEKWRPPESLSLLTPEDLPELVRSQFTEKDGTVGTPIYVYLNRGLSQSRGENLLRIARIFESVKDENGEIIPNASRSTVFAAMIRAMEHDGPLATTVAFLTVTFVTILVTRSLLGTVSILGALLCGVLLTVGGAAWLDVRLNFLNFVALPLTFGIGVEYAINLFERIQLTGRIEDGVASVGGPVALCSLTTIVGYGALLLADNMALQSFGRYAIAGEFACIVTALLVLPAALHKSGQFTGSQSS